MSMDKNTESFIVRNGKIVKVGSLEHFTSTMNNSNGSYTNNSNSNSNVSYTNNSNNNLNFEYDVVQRDDTKLHGSNWKCIEGVNSPVRYYNNNIECLSSNNKDCITAVDQKGCEELLEKYSDGSLDKTSLSCGQEYKSKYGLTGYDEPNHWCFTAKNTFNVLPDGSQGFAYYIDIESSNLDLVNKKAIVVNVDKFYRINELNKEVIGFNGKNTKLQISSLELPSFSISFLIKIVGDNRQVLVSSKSGKWYIDFNVDKLRFVCNEEILNSPIDIKKDTLYHVCISVNNYIVTFFVNGKTSKKEYFNDVNTTDLIFGCNQYDRFFYNGLLGAIKIYRRKLETDFLCNLYKILCVEQIKKTKIRSSNKCLFIPGGENKIDCINNCNTYDNCDVKYCQDVCENCIDYDRCKWVKPEESPKEKLAKNVVTYPPNAPEIKAYAKGINILVDWVRPYDGGSPINNYMIFIQETFNKSGGVRVSLASDENCSLCSQLITGLKPNTYYSVSVRAVNNSGMGDISNIVDLATKGGSEPSSLSKSLLDTDAAVLEQVKIDTNYSNKRCNNYGHILDITSNSSFSNFVGKL